MLLRTLDFSPRVLLTAFPLPIPLAVVRILARTSHVVTRTLSVCVCVLLKYHNVFVCVYMCVCVLLKYHNVFVCVFACVCVIEIS
jgi:hypothetical protein